MKDQRRSILERVAAGDLSPEEGAVLLDELAAGPAAPGAGAWPPPGPTPPTPPPANPTWPGGAGTGAWAPPPGAAGAPAGTAAAVATPPPTTRLRVCRSWGSIRIEGDPGVAEAVVDGPHTIRRDQGTLIVEDGADPQPGDYQFTFGTRPIPFWRAQWGVRMRVNPALPLEIESQAGAVRVSGIHAPVKADVTAGSLHLDGAVGPLDLSGQAGSIHVTACLRAGASRIRCEAGSVRVQLLEGSSVRVRTRATLGRILVEGAQRLGGEWLVGGGEATLDIDSTMGSIRVGP